jgi:hypothetical protein
MNEVPFVANRRFHSCREHTTRRDNILQRGLSSKTIRLYGMVLRTTILRLSSFSNHQSLHRCGHSFFLFFWSSSLSERFFKLFEFKPLLAPRQNFVNDPREIGWRVHLKEVLDYCLRHRLLCFVLVVLLTPLCFHLLVVYCRFISCDHHIETFDPSCIKKKGMGWHGGQDGARRLRARTSIGNEYNNFRSLLSPNVIFKDYTGNDKIFDNRKFDTIKLLLYNPMSQEELVKDVNDVDAVAAAIVIPMV